MLNALTFAATLAATTSPGQVNTLDAASIESKIATVVAKQLRTHDEAEAARVTAAKAKDEQLDRLAEKIAAKVRAASGGLTMCECLDGALSLGGRSLVKAGECTDAYCQNRYGRGTARAGGDPFATTSISSGTITTSIPGSTTTSTISSNSDSAGGGCFAKGSTTACLLASPAAECEHVLMTDLVPGDLVLGRDGATTVIAVQHKSVDTITDMLTFHTAGGAVSMTPNHAVFADGVLIAATDVKVGALLSTGAISRITKSKSAIINPVTAAGTIVADGVLAASNPYWIASLTVDAPLTRAVVNAAIYAIGDVDSFCGAFTKVAATVAVAATAAKAFGKRSIAK